MTREESIEYITEKLQDSLIIPNSKFSKGDTVTNLFDYGTVIDSKYSDGDGFDYPGWWYRVQVDGEKYWVWMYEPDMVYISDTE